MIGTPELIVIFAIAFLVFGGKRLPEIGSGLGQAIASFKKGLHDMEDSARDMVNEVPGAKEVASIKQEARDMVNEVPGVKEVASIKQDVATIKDMGKVLK